MEAVIQISENKFLILIKNEGKLVECIEVDDIQIEIAQQNNQM